ncbi:F-box domain-containing protein [Mycena venus]|uniref:F-box domain-containing protein n=1 Tax=Mycena venus TaxID=2733690 RepID=A0A8H7D3X5_9AGAR|nr:F-box domain-containing protein [Mycena venus]
MHTSTYRRRLGAVDGHRLGACMAANVPSRPGYATSTEELRSLSVFITDTCDVADSIALPHLTIFWIGTEVDLGPLFKRLTLPSLLNLNVFCANLEPPIPQISVTDCIARSGSQLRAAIFKSLRLSNHDLIALLRLSPSLRLLEISNDDEALTGEILGLLTAGDSPCLCPNLEIIRFLESSLSSADGVLADMVASRQSECPAAFPAAPLTRFVVQFSDAEFLLHTEDIRRLKNLESDHPKGFRVWINEPETE